MTMGCEMVEMLLGLFHGNLQGTGGCNRGELALALAGKVDDLLLHRCRLLG